MKHFNEKERVELERTLLELVRNANQIPGLAEKYNLTDPIREFKKHGIDNANYFTVLVHRKIFRVYLKMHEDGIPINIDSFKDYLEHNIKIPFEEKKEIFEKFLLMRILEHTSLLYFEYYIHLFKEHLIMDYWKYVFNMWENGTFKSHDILENSFGIVDGFQSLWKKITKNVAQESNDDIKESLRERVNNRRLGISTSVTVGLPQFDEFTGGFENTELYLLAGRPSMGKTTVAVAMIKRAIANGKKVHFFTLEMSKDQLLNRFIADEIGINYKDIKRGNLDDVTLEKILSLYDYYESHPFLIIEDLISQSLAEFHEKIKTVESDWIVVDYLQLFTLDGEIKKKVSGNREQEVGEISKALKRYAKEVKRPILALSQLSRAVEMRGNKRPILSDLRESGSLEQDADVIIFVYRKAYYDTQNGQPVDPIRQGNVELIIAKGREIGLKDFEMWLDLGKSKIFEGFRY